ncbi:hypothetical protein BDB01DRAFT_873068 [Pilobolus umbonatus]|nr:hypothetical protein BDB01DRAFT_873068 [Pilobolus umbonatus]
MVVNLDPYLKIIENGDVPGATCVDQSGRVISSVPSIVKAARKGVSGRIECKQITQCNLFRMNNENMIWIGAGKQYIPTCPTKYEKLCHAALESSMLLLIRSNMRSYTLLIEIYDIPQRWRLNDEDKDIIVANKQQKEDEDVIDLTKEDYEIRGAVDINDTTSNVNKELSKPTMIRDRNMEGEEHIVVLKEKADISIIRYINQDNQIITGSLSQRHLCHLVNPYLYL